MARKHSSDTVVILDSIDISEHCNTSTDEDSADSHDLTTYGKKRRVKGGGLKDGKGTIGGFYDSSLDDGPRAVIKPLVGSVVPYIYRPEGTGTGKPQTTTDVLVVKYTQTAPVADYITWSADLEYSDDLDEDPQV